MSSFICLSCLVVRLGERELRHDKVFSSPGLATLQTGIEGHDHPALPPQASSFDGHGSLLQVSHYLGHELLMVRCGRRKGASGDQKAQERSLTCSKIAECVHELVVPKKTGVLST